MMVLLETSEDLAVASAEIGMPCGQLVSLARFADRGTTFGIDNGFYAHSDPDGFLRRVKGCEPYRERCKFVVVPDVVGSARRTLELFERWAPRLEGWPLALAIQDGQEDLPIPWDAGIKAVFIGGTTAFKMSFAAETCIRAAQGLGLWTHVGRVNTPSRMTRFEDIGVDSCDGTGISRFSWMRKGIADRKLQPALLEGNA